MTKLPLEGIRVLDVGDVFAGPFSCTLLGDWGAEVIKVESIQRFTTRGQLNPPAKRQEGAPMFQWGYPEGGTGQRPWNRHFLFNGINRNKQGVTLDLRNPTGVELYKRLVAESDVIIENYAYGVMERLGIGYDVLSQVNPQIIMVSMPQFGNTGSLRHYKGWGTSAEAMTGHFSLRGYHDQDVEKMQSMVHTDATSSSTAPFAVVAALYHRRRTGKGQFIDFGQCEAFMPHMGEIFMDYVMNGRVASRIGNRHPVWAPHGCYPSQPASDLPEGVNDRWITIACRSEDEWQLLCREMGDPSWAKDSRFGDMLSRKRYEDELDQHIAEWAQGYDHYDLFHKLQAAGVPAGPVLDFAEAYADPHLNDRGFFEEVEHTEAGTHSYIGMTWRMSKSQGRVRMPSNCLGEHNHEVLMGLLGLTQEEVEQLEADQIIGTEFLPGSDQ